MLIQQQTLPNGVSIEVRDLSHHYYGGFHKVRLEVICSARVPEEMADEAGPRAGSLLIHRSHLEQMGVAGDEIPQVQQRLLDSYFAHSLRYLSQPDFPAKLAAAELKKIRPQKRYAAGITT